MKNHIKKIIEILFGTKENIIFKLLKHKVGLRPQTTMKWQHSTHAFNNNFILMVSTP